MHRVSLTIASIASAGLLVAACGTAVYPRVGGTADPSLPPLTPPTSPPGPGIFEGPASRTSREVCRAQSARSGWVITSYVQGGDSCPRREGDNGYNVAVIEHTGSGALRTMTICADQAVPRGWRKDSQAPPAQECAGARVAKDQPTSMVIRRL